MLPPFPPPFAGPSTHPLAPRRILTLPRESQADLVDRGRQLIHRSSAKIDLIVRAVDALARYYDRADLFEPWLRQVMRREELASTGIGRHVAILDYRLGVPLPVDEPPADWWLFLVPDGCDWQALDDLPVHVVFNVALADPSRRGTFLRELEHLARGLRRLPGAAWRDFSRLPPLDAARCFNSLILEIEEDRVRPPAP